MDLERFALREGSPVVVYLQGPTEKVWGLLLSMTEAGVMMRGLDLNIFEDWMRQESRGEDNLLGLTTVFYPMHRVLRVERDEPIGPLPSLEQRFARVVGKTVAEALAEAGRVKQ